jgi:uncharacterized membrane protein
MLVKYFLDALLIAALLYAPSALAYIGPGLGGGAIAAILGVFLSIIMLIIGVVWYPLKRLVRRIKNVKQKEA